MPPHGGSPENAGRVLWRGLARISLSVLALTTAQVPLSSSLATASEAAPPPGFEDTVITQFSGPTALAFTPDGRLLITAKTGRLRVFKGGVLLGTPALDVSTKVCSDNERGMLGIAVDPAFATNRFIYLYYTFKKFGVCDTSGTNTPVNRVSRFTLPDSNVIDPATEMVLVDNMPSVTGVHNAGDLQFGKDGFLYITIGDGGNRPCSRDQSVLCAKTLRITSSGGIPASNPFQGSDSARCNVAGHTAAGMKCQETYAWGLRNPYRMAFDPNAAGTRFFINDVGASTWEEIDLGQSGADYGWDVREGPCARGSTTNCGPPPAGMTNPIYWYQHDTLFPTATATACNSVVGGAFVPNGLWPAEYDNTYLFSDFTCGAIFRLKPDGAGGFTRTEFMTGLGNESPVAMTFGPHGGTRALYYVAFNGGKVHRIAFTGTANRAPIAVASASPTSGPAPLDVRFDGTGSSDPDSDPLTYEWTFGDGTPVATGAIVNHRYAAPGTYTATLRVRDNRGGEATATVRIDVGNTAPRPVIELPTEGSTFAVGQSITLRGSATDDQDGTLGDTALTWTVIRHHESHTHPFLSATRGNNIVITGPAPEDLAATTTTYLEIQLTATDSNGLTTTVTRNIHPRKVNLTFQTAPTGFTVEVAGTNVTGPSTVVSWEAWVLNVNAPDQVNSGEAWTFFSWSDGGAAAHSIKTPASPTTYTATFRRAGADLALVKADPPGRQPAGRTMTYVLTVTNNGPDAALGVTVIDQLPPSVAFVSATSSQGSCGESSRTVTCTLGTIGRGATATISIAVNPGSAGMITNTASVSSAAADPNRDNNADSESTTICRVTSRRSSVPCP
jgi:uncharacterized repeat protein (TIGR01451 family)